MSIFLAPEAVADLDAALAFLDEHSPAAAQRLSVALDALLVELDARAFEGPEVALDACAFEGSEVALRAGRRHVRTWPLPPFRVYYERRGDVLYVLRIYHQARRPLTR